MDGERRNRTVNQAKGNAMTNTTTEPDVLTAEDLTALRTAHDVTFHVTRGEGFIVARTAEKDVFTAREQRLFTEPGAIPRTRTRKIPCDYTAFGYSENGATAWTLGSAPNLAAFASVSGFDYGDNTWPTIARFLRTGDGLTMSWVADNNNGYTRDVGYHVDRLSLRVYRGKVKYVFRVDETITPDNSARMIRRNG